MDEDEGFRKEFNRIAWYDSTEVAAHVCGDLVEYEEEESRFIETRCDICGMELGGWGTDPNHHGGVIKNSEFYEMWPGLVNLPRFSSPKFQHYCARCCPDCG